MKPNVPTKNLIFYQHIRIFAIQQKNLAPAAQEVNATKPKMADMNVNVMRDMLAHNAIYLNKLNFFSHKYCKL